MIQLDPRTTALVLIDLQKGIMDRPVAPHASADVVDRAKRLAAHFRSAGAPVVLVTVDFSADGGDALKLPADRGRPVGERPAGWSELVEGLEAPGDIRVMKRQWGAFYGTDLDLQLRRRGIQTIVLGGIATNMGVESTARPAWEHNYAVVIVEDLCSSLSAEMHAFAVQSIFPMIARVVQAADLRLGA